ncbi:MAG TPA: glutathione S-transferase [Burkholderiales bacterium]|nr:glutathione S-transferase [Burkholderiales bacterium]
MIDLYLSGTANGYRASVALEEAGLPYRPHKIDLAKGEQRSAAFLKINPAGMIPAMVDPDGPDGKPVTVAQSGAIILYAADKSGRFLPKDPLRRMVALQWFMQAATDVSATSGALFRVENSVPDKVEANSDYFRNRLVGFFRTCDAHLADHEFFADEFSVAELFLYPNYAARKPMLDQVGGLPNLHRWGGTVGARPAMQKGMKVLG